jgi:autotransporter adhesin
MKTLPSYLILFLSVLTIQSGFAQQKREMPVGDFRKLALQGNLQVELSQGAKAQVVLLGSQEDIDEVTISTSGDKLTLKTKLSDQLFGKESKRRPIRVQITYTALNELTSSRGADIEGKSVLKSDDLEIKAHSGSQLSLEIQATNLKLAVSEGAKATIRGTATVQKTSVNTSAELIADRLVSEIVNIRTTTGANAKVNASKTLEGTAGTGGHIQYRGQPGRRDVNTTLGGTISPL